MHDDFRAGGFLQPAVAADVIGVTMGGDDIDDIEFGPTNGGQEAFLVTTGIDNDSLSRFLATEEIAADTHHPDNVLFYIHGTPLTGEWSLVMITTIVPSCHQTAKKERGC